MKKIRQFLMAVMIVGSGYSGYAIATDTDEMQAKAGFRFETARWTAVEIKLSLPDGKPALLSFYSEGPDGLRLLENAFTDSQGFYIGKLRLPAHLAQVLVAVRTPERQTLFTLPITNQMIAYAE